MAWRHETSNWLTQWATSFSNISTPSRYHLDALEQEAEEKGGAS
jgi:hypothetical protein